MVNRNQGYNRLEEELDQSKDLKICAKFQIPSLWQNEKSSCIIKYAYCLLALIINSLLSWKP